MLRTIAATRRYYVTAPMMALSNNDCCFVVTRNNNIGSSAASTTTQQQQYTRNFGTGTRGSRGHGWYINYRAGKGGRHLQGQFFEKQQQRDKLVQWNRAVLDLGNDGNTTWVYMDILLEAAAKQKADEEADETSSSSSTIERLYMEMNPILMPKVCENFIGLLSNCSSSNNDEDDDDVLSYKNSKLYRIEKTVGICGGDILTNTGTMGRCLPHLSSIHDTASNNSTNPLLLDLGYEPHFTSEQPSSQQRTEPSMAYYHLAGMVSMLCSTKVNCVDSRFILLTNDAFHLDGYHIPFGKLDDTSLQKIQEWEKNIITQNAGIPSSMTCTIVGGGLHDNAETKNPKQEEEKEQQQATTTASA